MAKFQSINQAYDSTFKYGKLSLGLVVPIENYDSSNVPKMEKHIERVKLAEELGFKALWLRDVPFNVPQFGDAGQTFDPLVYLGYLAASTSKISLGVASLILPLRHPAHVAKSVATIQKLSNERLLLGVASGDRPEEYPALNINYNERGESFRESYEYIRAVNEPFPKLDNKFGKISANMDMLPKMESDLPMLITGSSRQSDDWIAQNGNGWILYPRNGLIQKSIINNYRQKSFEFNDFVKPVIEPLYIDLSEDDNFKPKPIHLGLKLGINYLKRYLHSRENIGVNHVALNLRFNKANIEKALEKISKELL